MVQQFPYIAQLLAFLAGAIVGGWAMVFVVAGRPKSDIADDHEDITGIGA